MGEGRGGAHLANLAHLANPEEPRWGGGHLARAATPANQLQLAHSVMPAHLAHSAAQGSF